MSSMWGGRFEGGLDPFFEQFNRSLPFDRRLLEQDIRGSHAWADALVGAEILSSDEARQIHDGLDRIAEDCASDPTLIGNADDEDIHGFVERKLGEQVGGLAKKLHTGRSRNDQVATDLKLWLKTATTELDGRVGELQSALLALAERTADLPIPGYTHLQRGQPVTAGHHALAYLEMLARDRSRIRDAITRADESPLGSGALAGTAFPIDREALAKSLGFRAPTRNSLDTVSDRDHVAEVLFACSLLMVHLSRLCEDWIFYGSYEASMVRFHDSTATGSSLMPQKKNPDALELIRGKCGRVHGHLQALMMTMKGLPLAYDKDLQEDKEGLFDALDQTSSCVRVMRTVVDTIEYDEARCRETSGRGYLNATDAADLLVRAGVPFRDAHERCGKAVLRALELGVELEQLPEEDLAILFGYDVADPQTALSVEEVLARRNVVGGTAPGQVRTQCHHWRQQLEEQTR
ncbi:MAG: argininosuccinate lyase [Planctomycetota bacterium]